MAIDEVRLMAIDKVRFIGYFIMIDNWRLCLSIVIIILTFMYTLRT